MSEFDEKPSAKVDLANAGTEAERFARGTAAAGVPAPTEEMGRAAWAGGTASAEAGRVFDGMYDVEAADYRAFPTPTDSALKPIRGALNDRGLTAEQRAQLVLNYRNAQLPLLPPGAALAASRNEPAFPLRASGPAGLQGPLLEKLATDPEAQGMMWELSARVLSADPGEVDIDALWEATRASSRERRQKAGDLEDKNVQIDALRSMAALMQAGRMRQLPESMRKRLPPGLMEQMFAAHKALSAATSTESAVMSRGSPGRASDDGTPSSSDHNYHFFSHAYLAASLMHEHGTDGNGAEAMSAFAGAQYELEPHSIAEGSGNASLKDILMNAEGATYGRSLMEDNVNGVLPGSQEGPELEDKSIPRLDAKNLPSGVASIVKEGGDLSMLGMLGGLITGSSGRQAERNAKVEAETGIPVLASPEVP